MIFDFENTPKETLFALMFCGGHEADFPDPNERRIVSDFSRDYRFHRSPVAVRKFDLEYADFATEAIDAAEVWLREDLAISIDVAEQYARLMLEQSGREIFKTQLEKLGKVSSIHAEIFTDESALEEFFLQCAELSWPLESDFLASD
jgi:hypothetical protein